MFFLAVLFCGTFVLKFVELHIEMVGGDHFIAVEIICVAFWVQILKIELNLHREEKSFEFLNLRT